MNNCHRIWCSMKENVEEFDGCGLMHLKEENCGTELRGHWRSNAEQPDVMNDSARGWLLVDTKKGYHTFRVLF